MEERLEAGDKKKAYTHVSLHERVGAFCNVYLALMCVCLCQTNGLHTSEKNLISSTTIESRKFRIPSDLRRQPGYRPVSSKVGDHLRILLGVVVHTFLLFVQTAMIYYFIVLAKPSEVWTGIFACVYVHL